MLEHWNKLHAGQDRMRTAGEHRREKHSGSMIPDDFCFGSQTGGCASVTQCAGTNEGRRRAMVVKQLTALAMIAVVTIFVPAHAQTYAPPAPCPGTARHRHLRGVLAQSRQLRHRGRCKETKRFRRGATGTRPQV